MNVAAVAALSVAVGGLGCSSARSTEAAPADAAPDVVVGSDADAIADSGGGSDGSSSSHPHPHPDASVDGSTDASAPPSDAESPDALPDGGCFVSTVGVFGECTTTASCAALGDHDSDPGYCPGPSSIECCTVTPNVANDPPPPAGWVLMQQADVTSAMTTWAVDILDAPTTYPMFSTTTQTFGSLPVLALVEWHPPDSNNETVHRGVTLFQPTD